MKNTSTKKTKGSSTAMGMAASQARFLGLTARKNNVEFEGQQINQQRTTLSNQSANYYNNLLGMSVPVPPSVDDYTKTVYTFQDGALTNQVTAMISQPNGQYTVSYLRTWTDDFSVVGAATSIVNRQGTTPDNYVYKVGSDVLYKMATRQEDAINKMSENELAKLRPDDDYWKSLSSDQQKSLLREENEYITLLNDKYGTNSAYMVRYVQNTTTGEWSPYFYKKSDLDNAIVDDDNGNTQSNINCYTIGSETKTEEVKARKGCEIEKDSSGRYINITIPTEYDKDGNPVAESKVTYALTTETATDQAAYEDAMNQYQYDKYEYDQAIQEINAKIEIVQAQDKDLELRLKQLDTEQRAISTEIDAVSQVIQKNTESSFKTFG